MLRFLKVLRGSRLLTFRQYIQSAVVVARNVTRFKNLQLPE